MLLVGLDLTMTMWWKPVISVQLTQDKITGPLQKGSKDALSTFCVCCNRFQLVRLNLYLQIQDRTRKLARSKRDFGRRYKAKEQLGIAIFHSGKGTNTITNENEACKSAVIFFSITLRQCL